MIGCPTPITEFDKPMSIPRKLPPKVFKEIDDDCLFEIILAIDSSQNITKILTSAYPQLSILSSLIISIPRMYLTTPRSFISKFVES